MNSNLTYIFISSLHLPADHMILVPDAVLLALCLSDLLLLVRDVLSLLLLDLCDLPLYPPQLLLRIPVIVNGLLPHDLLRVLLRAYRGLQDGNLALKLVDLLGLHVYH